MERKIADKFFNNSASHEETKQVLEWLDTPEGRKYLEERLDTDFDLMGEENIQSLISELDSDRIYESIQAKLKTKRIAPEKRIGLFWGPLLKIAATIVVILTAYLFFDLMYNPYPAPVAESEPIHFQNSEDQQREITLGDGSVIRLNSNSEILIPGDFLHESREILLTGEAYFNVEHDPEKPFIIHANQSRIEVLGTEFNVKSKSNRNDVQVAVVEGSVLFAGRMKSNLEGPSVVLREGQFGYMDVNEQTIIVDDYAVENYLAWKNGRLVFDNLNLVQVCTQLSRLYDDLQCSYEDESFKDLHLTANFSSDSLEKTLSVISLSLKLDYKLEGNLVKWINENPGNDQTGNSQNF